jgi:radical SAM protein with 4Fe4S-binding SPASM domain
VGSAADNLFPTLSEQTRLKKMRSGCWLVDGAANGTTIHPLEAFVLALCTGENSCADMAYLVGHTLARGTDWGERLVRQTTSRWSSHLREYPQAAIRNTRYDAAEYLYPIQPTPRSQEGRLDSPGELTLILTHQCNFKCIYCFNSSEPSKNHSISTSEWLSILAQAAQQGVVKCTVSGGEPMTHPGFRDILKAITDHGMIPYVCTNGSLIEAEDIAYFKSLGLPGLQISLDAADVATHDKMSQARGSLPRVKWAIQTLIEAGVGVMVKSVITPLNFPGLGNLIDSCHDWGVTRLVLDRFDLSNAGRGNENLFLTRSMEQEMGAIARQRQELYSDDGFSVTAVDTTRCWRRREDIIFCGALSTGMTILPDGRVSLCEKLIDYPELIVGDLTRQSVDEVWNSPRVTTVLRPPADRLAPSCRDCPELPSCHTGCFAQTLIVTDDPYQPDPRCWNARYSDNPYARYETLGANHG